jgi:hypothetical protein
MKSFSAISLLVLPSAAKSATANSAAVSRSPAGQLPFDGRDATPYPESSQSTAKSGRIPARTGAGRERAIEGACAVLDRSGVHLHPAQVLQGRREGQGTLPFGEQANRGLDVIDSYMRL